MSELQSYYDNFCRQSYLWAHEDPESCACRGRGFFISDLDTTHKCPYHGEGAVDPMSDDEPEEMVVTLVSAKNRGHKVVFRVRGNKVEIEEYGWNDHDGEWDLRDFYRPKFRPEARKIYREYQGKGFVRCA